MTDWKIGNRVKVHLPIRPTGRWSWVSGTVRDTDEPGLPTGVRVEFDYPVNGVGDCYATHAELIAETGRVDA